MRYCISEATPTTSLPKHIPIDAPLPQRHRFPGFTAVAVSRIRGGPDHKPSEAHPDCRPFPQRHRFPGFTAVAVSHIRGDPDHKPSEAHPDCRLPPQRHRFPGFTAVVEFTAIVEFRTGRRLRFYLYNGRLGRSANFQNTYIQTFIIASRPQENSRKDFVIISTF